VRADARGCHRGGLTAEVGIPTMSV
jgi:hypothetical protein